jgi:hypothetical protein
LPEFTRFVTPRAVAPAGAAEPVGYVDLWEAHALDVPVLRRAFAPRFVAAFARPRLVCRLVAGERT